MIEVGLILFPIENLSKHSLHNQTREREQAKESENKRAGNKTWSIPQQASSKVHRERGTNR